MSAFLLRLCLCALLLLPLLGAEATGSTTLAVGTNYGFETPNVHSSYGFEFTGSFHNPRGQPGASDYVPFALSENAGIAEAGSEWDPEGGGAAAGHQYGFMQCSTGQSLTGTMTAQVSGLSSARDYLLSFSYSTRQQFTVQDFSLSVTLGSSTLASLDIFNSSVVNGRWHSATFYFIYQQEQAGLPTLTFNATSLGPNQVLLLDQIRIKTAS